jgi:hypothetical protein
MTIDRCLNLNVPLLRLLRLEDSLGLGADAGLLDLYDVLPEINVWAFLLLRTLGV